MAATLCRPAALAATAAALLSAVGPSLAEPPLMQTWHPWQLDSVLVAWTLRQTLGTRLAFESVPRGSAIAPERAIDTPESPYRRSGRRTAFDEALRLHPQTDPCVPKLREAVRVVELAAWRKPEHPGVEEFEMRVLQATPLQPSRTTLAAAFAEIDRFCKDSR